MDNVLKAARLFRKAERLKVAANKAKEPERAAELRFQSWIAFQQAAELIKRP